MLAKKASQYCWKALKNVSRSFALTIPLVEKTILTPIVVGYLEARIIDSFEDEKAEKTIRKEERIKNIDRVIDIITNSENLDIQKRIKELRKVAINSHSNPYYLDLALNIDKVIAFHNTMNQKAKNAITKWFSEMAKGMKKFIGVGINTFEHLDEYCYYVGGTIGGFLTQIIIENTKQATKEQIKVLECTKNDFGLFLQKVNIIRDFREDVKKNERIFWPRSLFLEHKITPKMALDRRYKPEAMLILQKMLENARKHIPPTLNYILAVPSDYHGYKKASAINFQMGVETLNKLENNPDVFYSDLPVKIDKEVKNKILEHPLSRLKKIVN